MDTTKIVEKALKGEDYTADVKDFDDEQLKNLNIAIRDTAKAEATSELDKVSALRKERERLNNPPPDKKEENILNQFRDEQVLKAKQKFFADPRFSSLTEDQKVQIEAEFKKLDSGKVDADLILNDLKKAYASVNSDDLLSSKDKVSAFEKNAADFMAGQAGGDAGAGSPDESKYSEAAKDLFKRWQKSGIKGKTLDDAQRVTSRGEDWRGRNLSS